MTHFNQVIVTVSAHCGHVRQTSDEQHSRIHGSKGSPAMEELHIQVSLAGCEVSSFKSIAHLPIYSRNSTKEAGASGATQSARYECFCFYSTPEPVKSVDFSRMY